MSTTRPDARGALRDLLEPPPDQVDLGNFAVDVYFYPSKPAETIVNTLPGTGV